MSQLLKHIRGHKPQINSLLKAKKNENLAHGLLFTGPSGVGRQKVAWALAQTLICTKQNPACGECISCLQVEKKQSQYILFIAPDGLYIKVESIEKIARFLSLQSESLGRIIIIDSAHKMNIQAANKLLKILEEPPNNVYFILISSYLSALPITIRSRVQTVRFLSLSAEDMRIISTSLQHPTEEEWLIRASLGSRDNLEKWQEHKLLRKEAFLLLKQAVLGEELCSLKVLTDLVKKRESALFVCLCWQQILRDACMIQLNANNVVIHQDQKNILDILKTVPVSILDIFFQKVVEVEQDIKGYADSVLVFDTLCMQIKKIVCTLNKVSIKI